MQGRVSLPGCHPDRETTQAFSAGNEPPPCSQDHSQGSGLLDDHSGILVTGRFVACARFVHQDHSASGHQLGTSTTVIGDQASGLQEREAAILHRELEPPGVHLDESPGFAHRHRIGHW